MPHVKLDLSEAEDTRVTIDLTLSDTETMILEDLESDYGTDTGFACVAWKDRTQGAHFQQKFFRWPRAKYEMVSFIHELAHDKHCCVWKPTALLIKPERSRALASKTVSFEVDTDLEETDPEAWDFLRAFRPTLLYSGRPGHLHVKVRLDRALPQTENARLAQHLASALGITGSNGGKFQPHDLLRIAGTRNTKPELADENGRGPVVRPRTKGKNTTLAYLTEMLLDFPEPSREHTPGAGEQDLTPTEVTPVPSRIRTMLRQRDGGDGTARYKQTHKLVRMCAEYGLDKSQALWVLEQHEPSVCKFGLDRLSTQIFASWPTTEQQAQTELAQASAAPDASFDLGELDEYRELFHSGRSFIFDAPEKVPALWGHDGDKVWWSPGEGLMITGTTGVGKSTLAGLLVRGRLGLAPDVMGFPVVPGNKRVLYLAMDRPSQIQRSLRRQFTEEDAEVLEKRLLIWRGPPPSSFLEDSGLLLALAHSANADTVVVDSLKDAVPRLNDDESAGTWNRNIQHCAANGVEVIVLHHQRKQGNSDDARKPKGMSDVYGSNWLTAGLGSVLLLWREMSKGAIELSQLKGPAGEGNRVSLELDNEKGTLEPPVSDADKLAYFSEPRTAKMFAQWLADTPEVERADVEHARREIDSFVDDEKLMEAERPASAAGQLKNAKWFEAVGL